MAERKEAHKAETAEEQAGPIVGAGAATAAAVAVAIGGGTRGGRLPPEAAAFLTAQTRLAEVQLEHLHDERELHHRHLHLRFFGDRLRIGLQILAIVLGLALSAGLGTMAWQAHADHGLMIDAFSAPPDLVRDGLTGEVVAARFLDKLQAMQSATQSDRPASSFQNNWGSEIKVEIPETGLTFGDLEKLLRDKLGHVSHVTGEVTKSPTGIAMTARFGDAPPRTFEGPETNVDALAQQAAEAVYRSSQPYRFSQYLDQHGRVAEAFAVIADLAANGPPSERGWAYAQWSNLDLNDHGDTPAARLHALSAMAQGGGSIVEAEISAVGEEIWSGHDQKALEYSVDLETRSQTRAPEQTQAYFDENRLVATAWLKSLEGDERRSARTYQAVGTKADYQGIQALSPALAATAYALDHDLPAARESLARKSTLDEAAMLQADAVNAFSALPAYWMAAEAGDWPAALAEARTADAWLAANKPARPLMGLLQSVWIHPLEALAMARGGDTEGAAALIESTPADCYLCLRVRGLVAAERKDWPAAEQWFADPPDKALPCPSPMWTGASCAWPMAMWMARSPSSPSPTRPVPTSPIRWNSGARR